jgi:mycofactocin biosynthetic radical S-adenosylmethionine protein MftC
MRQSVPRPGCALAIEVGYACNQACAYCYNPSRESHMPLRPGADALLRRIERLAHAWSISTLTLTGGEPFQYPSLLPLLDGVCRLRSPVQLITNGTLIDASTAHRLAKSGLVAVQITLNGPTRDLHREHVGRDSFDQAIRGAAALVAEGVPLTGCVVVTGKNAAHVAEIIELWQRIGARQIALSRFSPAGMSLDRRQSWLPRLVDLRTAFAQAQPFARAGLPISCTVPVPACLLDQAEFAPIRFGHCAIGSPQQEFALGPDGALRLCTLHAARLFGGRDVLDRDWDLSTVMRAPEVTRFRQQLPGFCQGCAAAPTCLGGCGAASGDCGNGQRAVDPLIQQYFPEDSRLVPMRHLTARVGTGANP